MQPASEVINHEQCEQACTAIPDPQPLRCGWCRELVSIALPGTPDPHWQRNGIARCHRRSRSSVDCAEVCDAATIENGDEQEGAAA
jgi:hypothetical protein